MERKKQAALKRGKEKVEMIRSEGPADRVASGSRVTGGRPGISSQPLAAAWFARTHAQHRCSSEKAKATRVALPFRVPFYAQSTARSFPAHPAYFARRSSLHCASPPIRPGAMTMGSAASDTVVGTYPPPLY